MNNIKKILDRKGVSIRLLSRAWGKPYGYTHKLVNRKSLNNVQLGTIIDLAKLLKVQPEELYK